MRLGGRGVGGKVAGTRWGPGAEMRRWDWCREPEVGQGVGCCWEPEERILSHVQVKGGNRRAAK